MRAASALSGVSQTTVIFGAGWAENSLLKLGRPSTRSVISLMAERSPVTALAKSTRVMASAKLAAGLRSVPSLSMLLVGREVKTEIQV